VSTQSTNQQRTHATGKINVKAYEPAPYEQPDDGPALVRIHVEEDFTGEIQDRASRPSYRQRSATTRRASSV
jgi:hypothetical protein